MRIGEKPQECLQRFFDFFAGDREQARQQGDERVAENGRNFDAAKGGAPVDESAVERSGSQSLVHFPSRFFVPVETIRRLSSFCLQTCLTLKHEPRS